MKTASFTFSGILMTLLLAGFLVSGIRLIVINITGSPPVSLEKLKKNEIRTYEHLKQIKQAQDIYYQKSPKLAGHFSYSIFLTHLWSGVDPLGRPVKLDLIPEQLAIAVGPTKALDGYYFIDVRERRAFKTRQLLKINYQSAWAIAAIPRVTGQTGRLVFLIDQTGDIFSIPVKNYSSRFPLDPLKAGWLPLASLDDLKAWQSGSQSF